jgi:hypothetical protein
VPVFLTNAEFLVRYDSRWVGKQLLDTGAASGPVDLSDPEGPGGAVLAEFVAEASDLVLSACAVGDRYSEEDLYALVEVPDSRGHDRGKLLKRVVADLTMGLILKRRVRASKDEESFNLPYREALEYLELLRRGERIFYQVPGVPEAGLPDTAAMLPNDPAAADPNFQPAAISQNTRIFGDVFTRRGGW